MGELLLYGAFLDSAINGKGDILILSEFKLYIISLPQRKNESLNYITLPEEDSTNHKPDLGCPSIIRCWWLPLLCNSECILVLTSDMRWKLYQKKNSVKWIQLGNFSSMLRDFMNSKESSGEALDFVDLSFTGIISCQKVHNHENLQDLHINDHNSKVCDEYFRIESENFPDKYCLGNFDVGNFDVGKRKKKFTKFKKKIPVPSINCEVNELSKVPEQKPNQSVETGAVIQQLIKTSACGAKRVITYVLDGKQSKADLSLNDIDDKVLCICGADEEDSSADEEWVQCELCQTWQHVECVAYYPEVQDYFHCDNCLRKDSKSKKSASTPKSSSGKRKGRPPKAKADIAKVPVQPVSSTIGITAEIDLESSEADNENNHPLRPISDINKSPKQEIISPARIHSISDSYLKSKKSDSTPKSNSGKRKGRPPKAKDDIAKVPVQPVSSTIGITAEIDLESSEADNENNHPLIPISDLNKSPKQEIISPSRTHSISDSNSKSKKSDSTPKSSSGKQKGRPPKAKDDIAKVPVQPVSSTIGITAEIDLESSEADNENNHPLRPISDLNKSPKQEIISPAKTLYISDSDLLPQPKIQPYDKDDEYFINKLSDDSESSYGISHHGDYINCPCGAEESESGEEWVQCDDCDKWQHQACVNYEAEDATTYQCPSCKQIITYFSNKIKTLPLNTESLNGKNCLKPSKSNFRIPKFPKRSKDGFDEVGHSSCIANNFDQILQPIYIPKSLTKENWFELLKNCTVKSASEKSQSPDCNDSLLMSSPCNTVHGQSQDSSQNGIDNNSTENIDRGSLDTEEIYESQNCSFESSDFVFCFMLFTKMLVVLRNCSNKNFDLASFYDFNDRNIHLFASQGNDSNSEQLLAFVDYDTNDILIWTFNLLTDTGITNAKENFSIPTLHCADKKTIKIEDFPCIDKMMWLSRSMLLVCSMYSLACYDVDNLNVIWTVDHTLNFVSDWSLQAYNRIMVYDSMESHIIIDSSNGKIVDQIIGDKNCDELHILTKFSQSQLLKIKITSSSGPSLQYIIPLKLSITLNPFHEVYKSWSQHYSLGESVVLKKINAVEFEGSETKNLIDNSTKDYTLNNDSKCPICQSQVFLSLGALQVVCENSHHVYVDPCSKYIIDPFTAKLCIWCGIHYSNESEICGACSSNNMVSL